MAQDEPTEFYAGDSQSWSRTLTDYPAGSYAAAYSFRGPRHFTVTGTPNGDAFDFAITAAESGAIEPGKYNWALYVTWNSEADRATVDTGTLWVLPNPTVGTVSDQRAHAEIMLDAIEQVLQGKASNDVVQKSIGGIQIIKMRPRELERWRAVYSSEVRALRRKEKREQGLSATRMVRHRNLGRRA